MQIKANPHAFMYFGRNTVQHLELSDLAIEKLLVTQKNYKFDKVCADVLFIFVYLMSLLLDLKHQKRVHLI